MTSLTVVLTLLALLLFGGAAISDFVLALLIGIISGTYSSIFVASPLLVDWHLWDDRRHGRIDGPRPRGPPRTVILTAGARARRGAVEPWCSAAWHPDAVVEPRFRWTFPRADRPSPRPHRPRPVCGPARTGSTTLLAGRGVTSGADLDAWFADPLDGLHDPRLLPDADRLHRRTPALARDRGETGHGLRRLRCRRADRAGDHDARAAPLRRDRRAVRPEPTRRGPRPVAGRRSTPPSRPAPASSSPSTAARPASPRSPRRSERGIDVIVTDHHRVPPDLPRRVAIVNPHRADATYPDRRLAGSGVAFKVAQLLLADEPGGPAAALGPRRPRDHRDRRRRRADRRREPGDRPARPRAPAPAHPRPGIAALLERARIAPGRRGPRDHRVRHRAAAQRRRPGGGGTRGRRLLLADGRRARRPSTPTPSRRPTMTRRDLMTDGRRRGARARRTATGGRDRRPSSAGRGRSASSAWSRLAWSRTAAGRRSSAPTSATSSGPRAGATARWTWAPRSNPAPTCSPATAATPARPASSCRPTAGTQFVERFRRPRRRPRAARSAACRSRIDLALAGARRRLRPAPRARPRWRPCGPGNPGAARGRPGADGDPRPRRDRRPHPAHPPARPRRARRHRLRAGGHRRDSSTRATGSMSSPG